MNKEVEKTKNKINSYLNNYLNKSVFSFNVSEKKEYKVGDRWIDDDGNEWEQKEGYKSKVRKVDINDILMPVGCPKCGNIFKSSHDQKMWNLHKMCINCVAEYETKLRIEGKYEEYEKNKIKENVKSHINNIEEEYKEFLKNSKDEINFVNVVNEKLSTVEYEKWKISSEEIVKIKKFYEDYIGNMKKEYKEGFGEEYDKIEQFDREEKEEKEK